MKSVAISIIVSLICISLNGQVNCDSCAIFKKQYMQSGDTNIYNKFIAQCKQYQIDTIHFDSTDRYSGNIVNGRILIVKKDPCADHQFFEFYQEEDNKFLRSYEMYSGDTVFSEADSFPNFYSSISFQNCIHNFSLKNETLENSNGGIVWLNMLVLKDGTLDCIEILRSPDIYLSSEALRFFGNMLPIIPAINNGERVVFRIVYPFKVNID